MKGYIKWTLIAGGLFFIYAIYKSESTRLADLDQKVATDNLNHYSTDSVSIPEVNTDKKRVDKIGTNKITSKRANYTILDSASILNEKIVLRIQLDKEYYRTEIERLAYYIKEELLTKKYKRVFIFYYLPKMKSEYPIWGLSCKIRCN